MAFCKELNVEPHGLEKDRVGDKACSEEQLHHIAFLCLICFPHWVPCLPFLRHLWYLMLAVGLVTIQLVLMALSGLPCTLIVYSVPFLPSRMAQVCCGSYLGPG